ncbi:MAG: hypothetical protein KGI50_03215 [Patescibacteria group bacterium]|nr:hypothetical protein [Patescibacteria group bacterium]MDE2438301.1 hypothetical protein [Patescibacteria group bacterium]
MSKNTTATLTVVPPSQKSGSALERNQAKRGASALPLMTEEAKQYFDAHGGQNYFTQESVRQFANGTTLGLEDVKTLIGPDDSILDGTKCSFCNKVVDAPVRVVILKQENGAILTKDQYIDPDRNPEGIVYRGQAVPRFQKDRSVQVEVGHTGRCLDNIRRLGNGRKPLHAQSGYQAQMRAEELGGLRREEQAYRERHQPAPHTDSRAGGRRWDDVRGKDDDESSGRGGYQRNGGDRGSRGRQTNGKHGNRW